MVHIYLKKKKNINHDEYLFIITSYSCGIIEGKHPYPNKTSFIPKNVVLNKNRKYKTIMLDQSDGFMTYIKNANYYDYYFISSYHENIIKTIGNNIYPMVFNSTNRIIEATNNNNLFSNRKNFLLYSHRILSGHPIRKYMLDNIYSKFSNLITQFNDNFNEPNKDNKDYLHWSQSGRRHNPIFYEALKNSKIVDCTGGSIYNNIAIQIDSFKLWEVFFSGCCVIMIDLDLFGIKFPVQPINMKHYIGVTLNKEKDNKTFKDIVDGKINIENIANEGKKWAIENYSPSSFANYILNTCGFLF